MTYDITEVSRQLSADPEGAIARWEKAYMDQVAAVAEGVIANREKSPVVLLSGPSASSKTTTAARLSEQLSSRGVRAHLISLDNYYRRWEDEEFPHSPDGTRDLESPLCLDIPLLNEHFALLETGSEVLVPIYDFPSHQRLPGRGIRMDASQGDVFLFEGIHALNTLITEKHPHAYQVYVSPEDDFSRDGRPFCTPVLLRLMRRIVRDFQFRGATAQYSLGLWDNVVAGERRYISPFRDGADRCITTTLPYELGVLRRFVLPLLKNLPRDVPCREQVDAVLTLAEDTPPLSPALVPNASILREFIGARPE